MGAAFAGQAVSNGGLVEMLIMNGAIKTKEVERALRAVDRRNYIVGWQREFAYKDMVVQAGNILLSPPHVYALVLESLALRPGMSFLNIGSGTGYLSTMAGLMLGENDVNHGVELHEDCLELALDRLEKFKTVHLDPDIFEFCEPVFVHGNFLNSIPNQQYDRVYCGAACSETSKKFILKFVKIGGIVIMPHMQRVYKLMRISSEQWRVTSRPSTSFIKLVKPQDTAERGFVELPLRNPQTLKDLCRCSIRRVLRKNTWAENKQLEYQVPIDVADLKQRKPRGGNTGLDHILRLMEDVHDRLWSPEDSEDSESVSSLLHSSNDSWSSVECEFSDESEFDSSESEYDTTVDEEDENVDGRVDHLVNEIVESGIFSYGNVQRLIFNEVLTLSADDFSVNARESAPTETTDSGARNVQPEPARSSEKTEAPPVPKSALAKAIDKLPVAGCSRVSSEPEVAEKPSRKRAVRSFSSEPVEKRRDKNAAEEDEGAMGEEHAENSATSSDDSDDDHETRKKCRRKYRNDENNERLAEKSSTSPNESSDKSMSTNGSSDSSTSSDERRTAAAMSTNGSSDSSTSTRAPKQAFVHLVHNIQLTEIMRKKIAQLPLPPSLLLFINCNREL